MNLGPIMLIAAAAIAGCADMTTLPIDGSTPLGATAAASSLGPCDLCIVDRTFTRSTAKPVTESIAFPGNPAGDYVIDVEPLDAEGLNADIVLNGTPMHRPGGDDDVGAWSRHTSLEATNTLAVRLSGKPGSGVSIRVRKYLSISLAYADSSLIVGDRMHVVATVTDYLGQVVANPALTWNGSNASVLIIVGTTFAVDVDAVSPGRTTITGSYSGVTAHGTIAIVGWQHVALGGWYSPCGLTTTGQALCWGDNSTGQNGTGPSTLDPSTFDWFHPRPVVGDLEWKSIATGGTTCGLTLRNRGYCWGSNFGGEVGIGITSRAEPVPDLVISPDGLPWKSFGMGGSCGVSTGGAGYCWGNNWGGNVGVGTLGGNYLSPTLVTGRHTWASIAGYCGITPSGRGYCWGENYNGALGIGVFGYDAQGVETADSRVPTPTVIAGNHVWHQIGRSSAHACGVTVDGSGYCWGQGYHGQLGSTEPCVTVLNLGAPSCVTPYPARVDIYPGPWQKITAGSESTCGLTVSGDAYCWGKDPSAPPGKWVDIEPGAAGLVCGVRADDHGLYCWGMYLPLPPSLTRMGRIL